MLSSTFKETHHRNPRALSKHWILLMRIKAGLHVGLEVSLREKLLDGQSFEIESYSARLVIFENRVPTTPKA